MKATALVERTVAITGKQFEAGRIDLSQILGRHHVHRPAVCVSDPGGHCPAPDCPLLEVKRTLTASDFYRESVDQTFCSNAVLMRSQKGARYG